MQNQVLQILVPNDVNGYKMFNYVGIDEIPFFTLHKE